MTGFRPRQTRPCRAPGILLAIMLTASAAGAAHAEATACNHILPDPPETSISVRLPTAKDLVELRDIGEPDSSLFRLPSPFGISPDGKQVAFVILRADPVENRICSGLVTMPADRSGPPILLGTVDTAVMMPMVDLRGLLTPIGLPAINAPIWSPDGHWIAYLRRTEVGVQVWRVRPDGSELQQITRLTSDVEAFQWSADSENLIVQSRPGTAAAEARIETEGRSGFLYDARFVPNNGNRPQPSSDIPLVVSAVDLATEGERPATEEEKARLSPLASPDTPPRALLVANSRSGTVAWTAPTTDRFASPIRLYAKGPTGRPESCRWAVCAGNMVGLWWAADGSTLMFLRPEGSGHNAFAMYRWEPATRSPPSRLFTTTDVFSGCQTIATNLLCARDGSTKPRRVVLLNPITGNAIDLFDPNPVFLRLKLGSVHRLFWRNAYGVETFGDLVLPPDYVPGRRIPLVVVQYRSVGFLRGGIGDEYPVQVFAARGIAVLNVQEPPSYVERHPIGHWTSWEAAERTNIVNWRDRRSLTSSVLDGVRLAIRMGIADPAKIGITGMSDGATTTRFALINSNLFAAASISTCCMEPTTSMIYGGEAWAHSLREAGYPSWRPEKPFPAFWKPSSLTMNAAHVRTPILMQLSDDEYLLGLQTFSALQDAKSPVEMYVFPGEHHTKWQPVHRLSIYLRNLAWFEYWLEGTDDPLLSTEYSRWDNLRHERSMHIRMTKSLSKPRHP